MKQPLKNKILQFEQDYIETHIKWDLKLGDDIFKKIDVKRAVRWLKDELKINCKEDSEVKLDKVNKLINEAFQDVVKNKPKNGPSKKSNKSLQ